MAPIIVRFNDKKSALVDVARTIDANKDMARTFGKIGDHDAMKDLARAIESAGNDQNAHFAASELWTVYQDAAWQAHIEAWAEFRDEHPQVHPDFA